MLFLVAALLLSRPAVAQIAPPLLPQIVEVPSGSLRLRAFLWTPTGPGKFPAVLFNHGSGGPDALHTSGMTMNEAAQKLGPLFVKHGYAFLYLCRRGQGLSADQGTFLQDELKKEQIIGGNEARQHLQFVLMNGGQLDDVIAALAFLRKLSEVDPRRVAIVGHSFGGQLTLLAAARDTALRGAVTFGAAANSWEKSSELRQRLLTSIAKTTCAVMLIHAANDYDTAAGRELAAELERRHKPHLLKIYPAVGQTSDDGHNAVYTAIPLWEADVFQFLDEHVRR